MKKHSQSHKAGYSILAKFRLEGCRNRLKTAYPEFIYPLNKLQFVERTDDNCHPMIDIKNLSTDGLHIFYTPYWLIKNQLHEVEQQIMHIVLHGILGHFIQQKDYPKHDYRDPLMDAQVGYLLRSLGLANETLLDTVQNAEQQLAGDFSLKQYYRAIRMPSWGTKLYHLRWELRSDDHREWNYKEQLSQTAEQLSQTLLEHTDTVKTFWTEAQAYLTEQTGDSKNDTAIADRLTKQITKRLHYYGSSSGTASSRILIKQRSVYNYRELLHEFLSIREIAKEQPDSIDPMLYHYGLELYEDVPLIEPLEYAEQPVTGLIIIAVDVSGSCCGKETMEQFWNETYGCISQLKETCTDGEILILQCDTTILNEERISLAEFESTPPDILIHGFGGTSFVPVFKRIDMLSQNGDKVEALLYLTDGDGEYPDIPPNVPTYFILPHADYDRYVQNKYKPAWITPVRLEERE